VGTGHAVSPQGVTSRLPVKREGRLVVVQVRGIDWIEAERNYVRLHAGGTTHTRRERLGPLADTLDPRHLARIHRSTIVNLDRVREMQPWCSDDHAILLENGTRLRLSRHHREQVERQVGAR
jgi:two-component system LytT family response regulator